MRFSLVELNLRSKAARQDIGSPYEMHRTLSRVLQTEPNQRFLWRLERQAGRPVLFIQSESEPDWTTLIDEDYLSRQMPSKPLDYWQRLAPGQLYGFCLKANPTVRRQGKRLGLVKIEEQLAWLHRQGEQNGFQILGAMVSDSEVEQYRKSRQDAAYIRIRTVRYDGHLKVLEPEAFRTVLKNGLGHAKAFGCGLLTLARA